MAKDAANQLKCCEPCYLKVLNRFKDDPMVKIKVIRKVIYFKEASAVCSECRTEKFCLVYEIINKHKLMKWILEK